MSEQDPPKITSKNKLFPDVLFPRVVPDAPKSKISFAALPLSSSQESSQASFFEHLTDLELIEQVLEMRRRCKYLEMDNRVIEKFLSRNQPIVVESMPNILKIGSSMQINEASKKLSHRSSSALLDRKPVTKQSMEAEQEEMWKTDAEVVDPAELVTESIVKVNYTQKTDLVLREMEDLQSDLEQLRRWAYDKRTMLRAELEEMQEREKEIDHATKWFEKSVVKEGVDLLTQRISFDKYQKFFAEWFRRAHKTMDKLRLRACSLKVACHKVNALLIQKRLEGENVHAVDFENLEILNRQKVEEVAFRTKLLFEMKTMQGDINLALSNVSKILQNKLDTVGRMEQDIEDKEERIKILDAETDRTAEEVDQEREMYESKKEKFGEFKVPDVLDYVRLKARLYELRRDIDIWTKRIKSKQLSLHVALLNVKQKTGNKTLSRAWLEPSKKVLEEILDNQIEKFEFQYEKKMAESSTLLRSRRISKRSSERMVFGRK